MEMDWRFWSTFPKRSDKVFGGLANDLSAEDITNGIDNHLSLLVSIITDQLREVLEAQADGNFVASCRGNQVIQAFEIDGRQLVNDNG